MTDPTNVDEIVVVGQRRRYSHEAFPGGGSGGDPNDGGTSPDIRDEADPSENPYQVPDPCADPQTALPWNADAEAAASVADFLARAALLGGADAPNGVPRLSNREFGRGLFRGSGSSVEGNTVTLGDPIAPGSTVATITINMDGITNYNYLGDVHSHPFGTSIPTQADWDGFMGYNRIAREAGRTDETFYLYIVVVDQNGNPSSIRVYQDGPRAADSADPPRPTTIGPEVNPDAQPCS